jgi:hypothetical protein
LIFFRRHSRVQRSRLCLAVQIDAWRNPRATTAVERLLDEPFGMLEVEPALVPCRYDRSAWSADLQEPKISGAHRCCRYSRIRSLAS